MILRVSPLVLVAAAALGSAQSSRQSEPYASYRDTHAGVVKSLQTIEAGVVPGMKRQGASYIGAEYSPQSLQYRLKFMNDGAVIWIDVDGRSGAIIGKPGQ